MLDYGTKILNNPMTDEQKLSYLITELKLAASHQTAWNYNGSFEDGEVYGWSTFAGALLESIGENND